MLRVAITGGIACGKSQVGACFAARNIPVCDTDELAHQSMLKGQMVYRRVVAAFGKVVLKPDGEIDRGKLARIVFGDQDRLKLLNSLVHPRVKVMCEAWLRSLRGHRVRVAMIPLLYEVGQEGSWDRVICVGARECDQRERLKARGLTTREITQRLAAQMPVWEKMERADYVIFNCGSLKLLEEQSVSVLNELLERKHA